MVCDKDVCEKMRDERWWGVCVTDGGVKDGG